MNDVEIFPAVYCDTGVSRFAGNPFIEEILQNLPPCLVGVSMQWQPHGHEAKQP